MTAQKSEFLMLFTALLLVCSAMLPPPVTALLAALSLVAAIAVSPLGYLAIGPLGALSDKAAESLF